MTQKNFLEKKKETTDLQKTLQIVKIAASGPNDCRLQGSRQANQRRNSV